MKASCEKRRPSKFWDCSVCGKRMNLWKKLVFGLCSRKCIKVYATMTHAEQYRKQLRK